MTLQDFILLEGIEQVFLYWDEVISIGCFTQGGKTFECKQK